LPDVFISYASSSQTEARQVADVLTGRGYDVWWDAELPAHRRYSKVIEERLREARAVVVLWSEAGAASEWVCAEADLARQEGKLVQAVVDESMPPLPFNQIGCARLTGWSGNIEDREWCKVSDGVASLVGREGTPFVPKPAAAAPTGEPLLAVLPFDNLSPDPDLAFFSDGISEEIINALSRGAGVRVIGRTSSFQFRGADKNPRRLAAELRASHILDGSVRRSGERVRIAAQLIEASGQTTLWSDRFDRDLTDVFAVQDEISAAVAQALSRTFEPTGRTAAVDPIAYDLYLRGSLPPTEASPDAVLLNLSRLEQAVARAPSFADAWGRLGFARALRAFQLPGAQAERMRVAARDAASRALALDPRCAVAAVAMSRVSPMYGAMLEQRVWLERALEWQPSNAFVNRANAVHQGGTGRTAGAVALCRRACELDPLDPSAFNSLGSALRENGELDEADAVFTEAAVRWPELPSPAVGLVFTLPFKGEFQRARDVLAARDLGPFSAGLSWMLQILADESPSSRERAIRELRRQFQRSGRIDLTTLIFAAHVGFAGEALDIAGKAEFGPAPDVPDPRGQDAYGVTALFAVAMPELRQDPRFVEVCDRIGLVEYWATLDIWPDCASLVAPYYDFKAEVLRVRNSRN
jgi:adenylate cyclase